LRPNRPLERLRHAWREYPGQFWTLVGGTFIDQLGGALLFPFFTLYVSSKFGVGMTEVGLVFSAFALGSLLGGVVGGALTDWLGRKRVLIFGLVASALVNLAIGLVVSYWVIFFFAPIAGIMGSVAQPARSAMVADLLSEEKRAQGYGVLRVANNLAVTVGPAIGGLLATRSFLALFVCDAAMSLVAAAIVSVAMRETKPVAETEEPQETMTQTFRGYQDVVRDVNYVLFLAAYALLMFVMMQLTSSLPVYLRDTHGVPNQAFGYLLTLNAGMVVLFQFYIARRVSGYEPLEVMLVGSLLFAIGYGLYGFVSGYLLFAAAVVILTTGELLVAPTGQALAAEFAPEDKRGRYMGVFSLTWAVSATTGPLISGLIMDNFDQRLLWYVVGLVGLVSAGGFAHLRRRMAQYRTTPVPDSPKED